MASIGPGRLSARSLHGPVGAGRRGRVARRNDPGAEIAQILAQGRDTVLGDAAAGHWRALGVEATLPGADIADGIGETVRG